MPDLLIHPLWTADTLGSPLPDNDFGVSVSLPLWQHVVGYEQGDPEIIAKFRSGYPLVQIIDISPVMLSVVEIQRVCGDDGS